MLVASVLWVASNGSGQTGGRTVDNARLRRAPTEEWLSYGRDQAETHFSPLNQIDASNVSRLGLSFVADTDSPAGNLQATPIVANGVIYSSLAWGVLYAADARTGKFKWRWDPEFPARVRLARVCAVERSIAALPSTTARSTRV
jgi:glucose dehydrogenase